MPPIAPMAVVASVAPAPSFGTTRREKARRGAGHGTHRVTHEQDRPHVRRDGEGNPLARVARAEFHHNPTQACPSTAVMPRNLVWGLPCQGGQFILISSSGHFPCSTAPQAFPRPDRSMIPPARAGCVKAGRSSAATRRCGASLRDDGLGLDTPEHDGTLVRSGPLPLAVVGMTKSRGARVLVARRTVPTSLYSVGQRPEP